MATKRQAVAFANTLGVTLIVDKVGASQVNVNIEAPRGHHWDHGGPHSMVVFTYGGPPISELWDDVIERMNEATLVQCSDDPHCYYPGDDFCEYWNEDEQ